MAQFKELLVFGTTRVLDNVYAKKFIGDIEGNADSATIASKDALGQVIDQTYIKNASVSGQTLDQEYVMTIKILHSILRIHMLLSLTICLLIALRRLLVLRRV